MSHRDQGDTRQGLPGEGPARASPFNQLGMTLSTNSAFYYEPSKISKAEENLLYMLEDLRLHESSAEKCRKYNSIDRIAEPASCNTTPPRLSDPRHITYCCGQSGVPHRSVSELILTQPDVL